MNERDIFHAALDFADADQRQAYLAEACGADAVLRTRVDALLAAHDAASQFLAQPAVARDEMPPTVMLPLRPEVSEKPAASESDDELSNRPDISFLSKPIKPGSLGRLGHYEIQQILGHGAFGIVFKAFDEKLHRVVAIKAMNPQVAATSPPRKRFLREARAIAAMKHENVVQIYSVEEQPLPYLAMEFVDGQTLQQKLDGNGPLEVPEILHLGRQMAAGLAAAHGKGLIHRDIKPSNILIESGSEQKVKITDFGLARAADDATMTRTGMIAGTPMYMAPEQAMGHDLDHRADLFSLGSVLYQMTSGRPPFRGSGTIAVLKRVVDEAPRPIRLILPEVPQWLCTIIDKLHAKNPDERYQTAQVVADLLARCQSELQATGNVRCVPTVGQTSGLLNDPSSPAVRQTSVLSNPASPTRNRLIAAAALVATLVGVAILTNRDSTKSSSGQLSTVASSSSQEVPVASVSTAKTGWHGWPADAPKPAIAPFDTEQAKQHQESWAKYLGVPVEYENSIGMKFRLIPPGEFMMGSTRGEIDEALPIAGEDQQWQECIQSEGPLHPVVLTQPLYMGIHEVTQGQYQRVINSNPSKFAASGEWAEYVEGMDTVNFPVEDVSWQDASQYANRLSVKEVLKPTESTGGKDFLKATGYRLPSEAEWEFACRAGSTTQFHSGDQFKDLARVGWWTDSAQDRTHAMGERQSNAFGLFDMHGNVWEWAADGWNPHAYSNKPATPAINPFSAPAQDGEHVIRGGNYSSNGLTCRSASRCTDANSYSATRIGLRLTVSVDDVRRLLKLTSPTRP